MLHRAWRYRLRSEKDELRFVRSLELAGKTVLDIGANWGIYSYWLHKKVGSSGTVVAFEPQPELAAHLERFKAAFGLRRLLVAEVALSSRPGGLALVRPRKHWGGASVGGKVGPDVDVLKVRGTTLDDYFAAHAGLRPVRFIKCDVESHELEVLVGGKQLLEADRPVLLFESAPLASLPERRCSIFELLEGIGYRGLFFYHGHRIPIESYNADRHRLGGLRIQNYAFEPS